VILALIVHTLTRRVSTAFRFVFYLPGAMAGAASVVVWRFMFDPNTSPWAFLIVMRSTISFSRTRPHEATFRPVPRSMAFFTGAGDGSSSCTAREQHSAELIEAAEIDGSARIQTA